MKTQLNPYKITWAIFTPVNGKFFKKNANEISKTIHSLTKYLNKNEACAHFPNKERAIELVSKINVSKQFKVTFITDKQFGLSKWNESLLNVATKMQVENSLIIGK